MLPPPETVYLPFEPGPYRMAMGLVARDPRELIELDAHYVDEMAQRRRLLDTKRAEVFAAQPGSEAARTDCSRCWRRCCQSVSRNGSSAAGRCCRIT
jgi:hypothetical protein